MRSSSRDLPILKENCLKLEGLQQSSNRFAECVGGRAATLIPRQCSPFRVNRSNGLTQPQCRLPQVQIVEHHGCRKKRRGRVDDVLPGYVWRRAVSRFKVGVIVPIAARWREPQAAHHAGRAIRQNIAVKVGCHDDIQLFRLRNHSTQKIVNNEMLKGYVRIVVGNALCGLEKQAVRGTEHIVFAGNRDFALLIAAPRQVETVANDALTAAFGNCFDRVFAWT